MNAAKLFFLTTSLSLMLWSGNGQAAVTPRVTFVELGATWCTPCKLMQPVMRSLESRYGEQLKVIFYNVSSAQERSYAQQYRIRLIPTQVFLDNNGKEFFRHEGFFPETEIDKLLRQQGLSPTK
ncbi:MAG: thioredoxin family protein [Chlorobium sp.]|nr:MAG: thioredoxin family protein [Chlorobium sp.]